MTGEAIQLTDWNDEGIAIPAPTPAHISARRDQTVGPFMADLRKFVVHRSLASTLTGAGPFGESPASSLSTHIRDLRAWNGWSAMGRQFVDTLAGDEPLEHVLAPYRSHVVEYCSWLSRWQASVHRDALEELSELQRGFRRPEGSAPEAWLRGLEAAGAPA